MARRCAFCEAAPVASIPQGRVCRTHAIEFYTELVKFAVDQARDVVDEPIIKNDLFVKLTKLPDKPGARRPRSYTKRSAYWVNAALRTRHGRAVAV